MKQAKHREGTNVRSRRTIIVSSAVGGLMVLGTTSAVAYWSTTGTGTGAAQARTFIEPTVSVGTASGAGLYPGLAADGTSTGATLSMTVQNSNPFPVSVTVSKSGTVTGCTTPDISVVTSTFTIPASTGPVVQQLPFTVGMGTNADNDCQGATVSIPLSTASTSN